MFYLICVRRKVSGAESLALSVKVFVVVFRSRLTKKLLKGSAGNELHDDENWICKNKDINQDLFFYGT
jgi:hypothetical protein